MEAARFNKSQEDLQLYQGDYVNAVEGLRNQARRARQDNMETDKRLDIWCKEAKGPFAEYALKGAKAGREYGVANSNKPENLRKINDFDWLQEQYNAG